MYNLPPLVAIGCGHNLLCCLLSNVSEMVTRGYHHIANEKNQKKDRQTGGRIAASLYAPHHRAEDIIMQLIR